MWWETLVLDVICKNNELHGSHLALPAKAWKTVLARHSIFLEVSSQVGYKLFKLEIDSCKIPNDVIIYIKTLVVCTSLNTIVLFRFLKPPVLVNFRILDHI